MLKFFRVPFALSGTRTAVPDAADPTGAVSYVEGYGPDYQRAKTDPLSKNIERDKMNEVLYDVTNAIAELQARGAPDFITSALNGGSPFPYGQGAMVNSGGVIYVSRVNANTAAVTDMTKWTPFAYDPDVVVNVKAWPYLAKGDGSTNDTAAINAAIAALQDGQVLYFPAGDYIVSGACLLIRGRSRITVLGEGVATRVRSPSQGPTGTKQDYPSTIMLDACADVAVMNMVIESKGENYGNTDAYGGLAAGLPRANAIANYGGSALVVARSSGVTIRGIDARYCGSVGVVYLSSCQRVNVYDSFANAKSLGYAGFAVDNWAESTANPERTYSFFGCRVAKEEATYAAKGGIVSEGDQITGRFINLTVNGCDFQDCVQGGDYPQGGDGVSAIDTRLTILATATRNCLYGVAFTKRGGAVDFTWCRVDGCSFEANGVSGVYVNLGTSTGGADISIQASKINSKSTSAWAAVGAVTNLALKESSGIVADGFLNGTIQVVGCNISGGQNGLYSVDNSNFVVEGSDISGINGAVVTYGGGRVECSGSRLVSTGAASIAVKMNTANKAVSASYGLSVVLTGNSIRVPTDTASDYAIQLSGNSALYQENVIKGNSIITGQIQADKGSSTIYDRDDIVFTAIRRALTIGLDASDTIFEVTLPKEMIANYAYAVGIDNVSRAIIGITNNRSGTRGRVQIKLAGDVRTQYSSVTNSRVILMQ